MRDTCLSLGFHAFFLAFMLIFLLFSVGETLRPHHFTYMERRSKEGGDQSHIHSKEARREINEQLGMEELYPTGSSLPDCAHACGACFPCRRVMVSFKCSMTESCPVVYRCTCRGRYYHVPTL